MNRCAGTSVFLSALVALLFVATSEPSSMTSAGQDAATASNTPASSLGTLTTAFPTAEATFALRRSASGV